MIKECNSFKSPSSKKVRVLSFQGKEVVGMLLRGEEYHPSKEFSREGRDYLLEKERYGFEDVIWCFNPLGFRRNRLINEGKFTKDDFLNGSMFEAFRCEMSVYDRVELNDLCLLELEYDIEDVKLGLTHNGCSYVSVVPNLKKENICAVYRLVFKSEGSFIERFMPTLKVIEVFKEDVIFQKDFRCREE